MTIWISDYVPNTMGYAIFMQNLLRYNLTYRDLPDGFKSCLNTTCSKEDSRCLGNMFPEISTKYPHSSVEVEIAVSKPPMTNISTSQIQLIFSGDMICRIRLSDGSDVELLKINVDLDFAIAVTLNDAVLKCNVIHLIPTVKVLSSSLDSIPIGTLSQEVETLCNLLLVPLLNKKFQEGIRIPLQRGVTLSNSNLNMENHCLKITTDIVLQLRDP